VVATGARHRKLPVPRLADFEGTSVFYAATLVEALLCHEDPVVVVGGANSVLLPNPAAERSCLCD